MGGERVQVTVEARRIHMIVIVMVVVVVVEHWPW